MTDKQYVFISYSRKDANFVETLVEKLRGTDIRVWKDTEEIQAGTDWRAALQDGISKASAMLFVSSVNSIGSEWMAHEMQAFLLSGRKVMPIVIDDAGEQRMPGALRDIQWVDFRSNYAGAFEKLIDALRDFIDKEKIVADQAIPKVSSSPVFLRKRFASIQKEVRKAKGYIFLSYAEEDAGFAEGLKIFLGEKDYAYWDYNDSDRDYHSQFFLELEGVIKEAFGTLSIVSPDWKLSDWTVKEFLFSEEVKTPVVLLRARDTEPTLIIAGRNYIDFVEDAEEGFKKLDKELERKGL